MDFVVVGFGLGALGVLVGLTLRDGGTWWWRSRAARPLPGPEVARRVARGRACRAGGRVLALGGGVACVATLIALAGGLADRAGALLVMVSLLIGLGAALAWSALYAHRYHPRPRRVRTATAALGARRPSMDIPIDPTMVDRRTSHEPASAPNPAPGGPEPPGTPVGASTAVGPEVAFDASATTRLPLANVPTDADPAVITDGPPTAGAWSAASDAPGANDNAPAEAGPAVEPAARAPDADADADADEVLSETAPGAPHAAPWRADRAAGETERRGTRALAHAGKTPSA